MTYEQLDFIADAYIPTLVIVSLYIFIHTSWHGVASQKATPQKNVLLWLSSSIVTVYLLMYIDQLIGLWKTFGSDYSTHTALALVFVFYGSNQQRAIAWLVNLSFIAYLLLMWYQQYHTPTDMLSTIAIILPIVFLMYKVFYYQKIQAS